MIVHKYHSHIESAILIHVSLSFQVWVVGEYLSTSYSSRCKLENIASMYEALEAVSYEVTSLMSSSSKSDATYSALIPTSLMSAVAKLASRWVNDFIYGIENKCLEQPMQIYVYDYLKAFKRRAYSACFG